MSGAPVPPDPWVDPTPIRTVERTATPVALPIWRMVLKKVEARPMDSGEILANDAAWLGTITCAIINPRTNIRARTSQRLVVSPIWVSSRRDRASPTRPPVM